MVKKLQERLTASEKKEKELQKKTQETDLTLLQYHEEITNLKQQLSTATAQKERLSKLSRNLQDEVKSNRAQIARLKEKLASMNSDTEAEDVFGTKNQEETAQDNTEAPTAADSGVNAVGEQQASHEP